MVDEDAAPKGPYERTLWLMLMVSCFICLCVAIVFALAISLPMAVIDFIFGDDDESTAPNSAR